MMLVFALIISVFWLIVVYNRVVNFEHGISAVKSELKSVQAENVELKEKIFGLFDEKNVSRLDVGLVKDKNPEYLEVAPRWSFASHY